ncbi:MAG TPA: class I SAM-dependent methyltransferase [Bryobacteraceae bacterium]|nr:class I SAM-dependent methyltransferase [Bryobacteraceae bacterium]
MAGKRFLSTLWAAEYETRGLPSSFRQEPSGAVRDFVPMALDLGIQPQESIAIDLGCGTGRNSLYLAEQGFTVCAIDIVPELISRLRTKAEATGVGSRLQAICGTVSEPWPVDDGVATVAIDTFCYKHLMDSEDRAVYRRELARVFKPGGLFLLTLASTEDGYYGSLPYRSLSPGMHAIRDPANGIESVLYERMAVEERFASDFSVVQYREKKKPGQMHGSEYDRVTHAFVMSRR